LLSHSLFLHSSNKFEYLWSLKVTHLKRISSSCLLFVGVFLSNVVFAQAVDITARTLKNKVAYIPPQCYTQTEDAQKNTYNPCYACHTDSRRPNYVNDSDLQETYSFTDEARENHWQNLFKDRSEQVAKISDQAITDYIRQSNYFDQQGAIKLANVLAKVPDNWDYNHDGKWNGFTPDIWFDFDKQGFDHNPKGKFTGWRAFGYYPYLGTFWPTNGSTDDVMIRLSEAFRTSQKGLEDLTVYKVNLAIVEAMVKEQDIIIEPVDESQLGNIDLDKDGEIGLASKIKYDWAPLKGRYMWYVGQANALQKEGKVHLAAGLYPEGTEFLHTVRYVDVDEQGNNVLSARMKEVRYALKRLWLNYSKLESKSAAESKEKSDFPNRIRTFRGNSEVGVSNGQGWAFAAFIEDSQGELRPQNFEELVFCAGCHSGIGAITDGIFSFHRKMPANTPQQGWFHWSQHGLKGLAEPQRKDGYYEYSYYLQQNKSANEFRNNTEVQGKFFSPKKLLNEVMLEQLHKDISVLLYASPQRALQLNKAYRVIVEEQSFILGRDAVIVPPVNVLKDVKPDQATGIKKSIKKVPLTLGVSDAYLGSNLDLFFPLISYSGEQYSAKFSLSNQPGPVWQLNQLAPALTTARDLDMAAVVGDDFGISAPFITDGENSYSAEMNYIGERDEGYFWALKNYQLVTK